MKKMAFTLERQGIGFYTTYAVIELFAISFNLACVQLCFLVVADAHEEDVAGVFGNLRRIFLAFYLVDGLFRDCISLSNYSTIIYF